MSCHPIRRALAKSWPLAVTYSLLAFCLLAVSCKKVSTTEADQAIDQFFGAPTLTPTPAATPTPVLPWLDRGDVAGDLPTATGDYENEAVITTTLYPGCPTSAVGEPGEWTWYLDSVYSFNIGNYTADKHFGSGCLRLAIISAYNSYAAETRCWLTKNHDLLSIQNFTGITVWAKSLDLPDSIQLRITTNIGQISENMVLTGDWQEFTYPFTGMNNYTASLSTASNVVIFFSDTYNGATADVLIDELRFY